MSKIGMREMLEAGAHFGHSTLDGTQKWPPIYLGQETVFNIINLQQTVGLFKNAYEFIITVARGGKVLFVGTKKQAQEVVRESV